MADHIPEVLAELEAADGVITPEIDGMKYVVNDNVSQELILEFNGEIVDRERRQGLIHNAQVALNALVADGYPDLPQETLSQELYAEWQTYLSNVEASKNAFTVALVSSATITLGEFVDKPTTE